MPGELPRFFVSPEQIQGKEVAITGQDVRHIRNSLRLKPEDEVLVLDGRGAVYRVLLESVEKAHVVGTIQESFNGRTEDLAQVRLIQGIPKGKEKAESIIRSAVPLGVSAIDFVLTERCVPLPKERGVETRLARWNRIATEEAKVARRLTLPRVGLFPSLEEALAKLDPNGRLLVAWEEADKGFKEVVGAEQEPRGSYTLLIGPEGGLTQEEVTLAEEHGGRPFSMGSHIFRTELAGTVAATLLLYELGALNS